MTESTKFKIRLVLAKFGPEILQRASAAEHLLSEASKSKKITRAEREELKALAHVYHRVCEIEEGVLYQRLNTLLQKS